MTFNGSLNGGKKAYIGGGTSANRKTSCVHANNPYGHSKECSCGWWTPPQPCTPAEVFPESPYGDLDDMDDYRQARFESDALDAAVDVMREERHFGY